MSCVVCSMPDGLHAPECDTMQAGADALFTLAGGQGGAAPTEGPRGDTEPRPALPRKRDLGAALEARGYEVLFSVGFGTRPDGTYSIKIAAQPGVRHLSAPTWQVMRQTIIGALDNLMASELDDLEIE